MEMAMPRNARNPNDLHDDAPLAAGDEVAPPAIAFTPLGPDPALGWTGLAAGALEPWAAAQAELLRGKEEGRERTVRGASRGSVEPS
jgi:hypothetical protein